MSDDKQLSALERITKLRDSGALSEEEFAAEKEKILAGTISVPFYRRLWVVVLLTLVLFPVAMIILLTGNVYRRKDGAHRPIGNGIRFAYGGILAIWLAAIIIAVAAGPKSASQHWAESADPNAAATSSANTSTSPQATAPSRDSMPNMHVTVMPSEYGPMVKLTGDDDNAFTIERVVLNGRANEKGCDLPQYGPHQDSADQLEAVQSLKSSPLPVSLKRGDAAGYFTSCGDVLTVDVYTDRGHTQYKFDSTNN